MSDQQATAEADALVRAVYPGGQTDGAEEPRLRMVEASRGLANLRLMASESLMLLAGATGLLLVLACSNVAGLLLARVGVRRQEIGTRLGMGATRRRLIAQLLTESLMLSVLGGVVGVLLSYWFNGLFPGPLSGRTASGAYLGTVAPSVDLRVLAFSLVLSALAGAAFGIAPALGATRVDIVSMIQTGATPRRRSGFMGTRVLVTAQVALAVVAMSGAGLLIRSLVNMGSAPAAYSDPKTIAFFSVRPGPAGNRGRASIALFEEALERIAAVPGVEAVSGTAGIGDQVCPVGTSAPNERPVRLRAQAVAAGYFATLGVDVVSGRGFTRSDGTGEHVAIVNEAYARAFHEGVDPVGQTVPNCAPAAGGRRILGVAADYSTNPRWDPDTAQPAVFIPFQQESTQSATQIRFVIRTANPSDAMLPAMRETMSLVDPDMPLYDTETGVGLRERQIAGERRNADVLIFFGAVALFLSCLGIYGVLAYRVDLRTAEVGIRMALGATPSGVVRMVARESLFPVVFGVGLGLFLSPVFARTVEHLPFGVTAVDPMTMAGVALVFMITACCAAFLPARRAARIHPVGALRHG